MSDKNVHHKRWTAEGGFGRVPELELFGFDDTRRAIPLPEHRHNRSFEFVLIESGKASWDVQNRSHETRTGEVFHTKPDEAHRGSYDVIEPCRFWWLIVRLPDDPGAPDCRWLGLEGEEARRLLGALGGLPRVTKPGASAVRSLRRIRYALERSDWTAAIEVRLCLVDFLLQLCAAGGGEAPIPPDIRASIDGVMREAAERPEWNPSLEALAVRANVSPSYYHKIFKAYTGLTPKHYFGHVKMSEASRLLKETELPITDIAFSLGYSSTQHFATAFRNFSGQTPTSWRAGGAERRPK